MIAGRFARLSALIGEKPRPDNPAARPRTSTGVVVPAHLRFCGVGRRLPASATVVDHVRHMG